MTLLELRTALSSALASQLGRYLLPGGSTQPALYVLDWARFPERGLPPDWTLDPASSGLECVIDPLPDYSLTYAYGGNAVQSKRYEVRLRAWKDPLTLDPALSALLSSLILEQDPIRLPATSFSVAEIRCTPSALR